MKIRHAAIALGLVIVLGLVGFLAFSLWRHGDVSGDPARNGGYHRGDIYRTRVELLLDPSSSRDSSGTTTAALVKPEDYAAFDPPPRLRTVAPGTILRITGVSWTGARFMADHSAGAAPVAVLVDGPFADTEVALRSISNLQEIDSAGATVAWVDKRVLELQPRP